MKECPCHWCEKRSVGCHGKCPDYKEWNAENEKMRKKRFEIIRSNRLIEEDAHRRKKR